MEWSKTIGELTAIALFSTAIAIWVNILIFRDRPRLVDKKKEEPCEWFEIESVEDLGRKIHAGVILLNRQARSDKWDDRKKDAFIRASRHIEAAHFEVTRLVK